MTKRLEVKLKANIISIDGTWRDVADACRTTIGLEAGEGDPSFVWKQKMLMCEHSPIRCINVTGEIKDLPYAIAMHFVRHKFGIEHWVSTQRDDRTGESREDKSQMAPVTYRFKANLQAIISISRKRLCSSADKTTIKAWKLFLDELYLLMPEMEGVCVPECIYRGGCPEYKCCGFMKPKEIYFGV
jgi:hypothetical protein